MRLGEALNECDGLRRVDEKKKKSEKEFDEMKNSLAEFFKAQESRIRKEEESNG